MEYNSIFEPLLCIFLSTLLGILIGCIYTLFKASESQKELIKELDKWRELYFNECKKEDTYYSGYEDDGYEAY